MVVFAAGLGWLAGRKAAVERHNLSMLSRTEDLDGTGLAAMLEEDLRSPCTAEVAVFQAFVRTVPAGATPVHEVATYRASRFALSPILADQPTGPEGLARLLGATAGARSDATHAGSATACGPDDAGGEPGGVDGPSRLRQ